VVYPEFRLQGEAKIFEKIPAGVSI